MQVEPGLVRAVQRGEPGAMDGLIRATYGDVYALCRQLLGDPADAADTTQEVYVRVVNAVGAFRSEAAFEGWLHRVSVSLCLTALQRRARHGAGPWDLAAVEPACPESGPEERAEQADLAERTAQALAQLAPEAREVVVLRDLQGLSTRQAAEVLGCSEGAVKVRLHRAHARLRELVGS